MPTLTLDKQTYPMMMHLSILPKYDLSFNEPSYDAVTQTSNINAMDGSWSRDSTSTGNILIGRDEDSSEDD